MAWIKLDDQWMDHPKLIRAGRDARDMWLASITWCAKHLTDGVFPPELIPGLAMMAGIDVANCQTFASTLLDVCLWEFQDGNYYVHDYLDYNPTKEQVEATKAARSVAGKAGGLAKASKMPSKTLAKSKQKSAPSPSPTFKESTTGADDENSFAAYEKNIGPLTSMVGEKIGELEDEHTSTWVVAAIREAVLNGARNLAYIEAILKRWKAEGYGTKKPTPANGKKPASPPATNWDNIDPDLYYIRLNGHKASKALMDSAWKRLVDNGVQIPDEYRRQYRQRFGPPYGEPGYVPAADAGAENTPAPPA